MPTTANGRSPGHVCVFTSAHPTDDVRVNSKIAASLLEAGYTVSWVGPARVYFAASAKVDPRIDYRFVPAARGRLGRIDAARRIVRAARDLGPVDWWYSPDPDAARAATWVARRRGGRVIFDIHEVYHGALLDRWLHGRRLRPIRSAIRRSIARTSTRSDLVIGVSASVLSSYVRPDDDWLVVRNCAPDWFSGDELPGRRSADGPMRVMHGKVIPSNGTPVVLDALDAMGPGAEGVQVVMLDVAAPDEPFASSVRARVSAGQLRASVQILQGVPHQEMPALLGSADVGMIAYGRGLGVDSLPNRLFEYMAAGMAILAPSYATEICAILAEEGIGITADFDDPDDVARALAWLRDHQDERTAMGRRARRAFLERHSWQREFQKLADAMQRQGPTCGS